VQLLYSASLDPMLEGHWAFAGATHPVMVVRTQWQPI